MTRPTITKEQAAQLAWEAGTPYVNRHYPGQTSFGFTEGALLVFAQAAYKLGRNAGLDAARKLDWVEVMREGSLVTWGDAGTLGYRVVEKLESLKDNTP